MTRTISKKLEYATEQYLASLGSARDRLADDQWKIVAKHTKNRRSLRWCLPLSICAPILCLCGCILAFDTASVLVGIYSDFLLMNAGQAADRDAYGEMIRDFTSLLLQHGANIGVWGTLAVLSLIMPWKLWFSARTMDKTLRAFLCAAELPGAPSVDKPPASR